MAENLLYYGDNLDVLRRHIKDESVDLVYLDPPFNSNANYNVFFPEPDGSKAAAQIKAFEDTWQWDEASSASYERAVEAGGGAATALVGFRALIGDNDMLAYLSMMAPRLVELRRVMKQTATIYLHCDPTASHYLKLLMDGIFKPTNFRNEIIWCYAGGGIPRHDFPRKHDVILRYTKGDEYFYQPIYRPYSAGTVQRGRTEVKGKYFEAGLREEGTPVNDWWPDVPKITSPTDPEKLSYPTQKSEALLERILGASSRPDDIVLDPFCGCGTTVAVAQRMGRPWIGIDITHLAIGLIKHRLFSAFGPDVEYKVIGEPTDLSGAVELAGSDPYQFQWWALGLVGARPAEGKKGADRGIDGRLFFHDDTSGKTKTVIFSVKAGAVGVQFVRDLRGVIERERAEVGVLISLQEPTAPMRKEAASAGFYKSPYRQHPRIQLLTVAELLTGRQLDLPPNAGRIDRTYKKARRVTPTIHQAYINYPEIADMVAEPSDEYETGEDE
jgi:site-specific DNA-methyltransferase (adenine-specific)